MYQQLDRKTALKKFIIEHLDNFDLSYLFNEEKFEEQIDEIANSHQNIYRASLKVADQIIFAYSKSLYNAALSNTNI